MSHVITSLCVRDRGCIEVCPVECIVPGQPADGYPMMYIDPDTCIDCGACVPECPFGAIYPEDEVPSVYKAKGTEFINKPGIKGHYQGTNHHGKTVVLETTRQLEAGEVIDLTSDIEVNKNFFQSGPGYAAKDNDQGV